jgi:hypothetical protein
MNGSFQLTGGTSLCSTPVTASGTFPGQAIAPLNGTYKGTLSDGNPWTIQTMQNSSFDINSSGTTTAQGMTTNFSFATNPRFAAADSVIGATMTGSGTATNINGSQQVSLVIENGSQLALGTLAKQ